MKKEAGFTLLELLAAIAIVAILGAIAMPIYTDYVRKGQLGEAYANLADMSTRLEQFFQDNRTYAGACVDGTVAPLPGGGGGTSMKYFNYTCSSLTATTYKVTATGKGPVLNFVFTINQTGLKTTDNTGTSGWTTNATCWVRARNGSC